SHSHLRTSDSGADTDLDGISDGRDVTRLSLYADWRRNWVLPGGLLGGAMADFSADAYSIRQDAVYQGQTLRANGSVAVELRWPWVRASANGASHVIEPVVQLVWAPRDTDPVPNEDSTLVEFDEGNLFSLRRFPGADAVERGSRANIGVSWTRYDPTGWSLGATLGRVIRPFDPGQFSVASGLDGQKSDWLAAVQLSMADGLLLTNRVILDDALDFTKAELRLDLRREKFGLGSSYVWMLADPAENRDADLSELTLDGRYRFTDAFEGRLQSRYDFTANSAASAGVVMGFKNECLQVDVSLSRRFTSSTNVKPSTDFGLSLELLGFGGKTRPGPARPCRG
ncbi:MAG: LPS assembly protein LptD, partial [Paracoccaceae bacterium]|nr:LPS assembly protein LptD [Paracoccaceae bacterium]